jgi:ribose transport system substrate-binding protein
VSVVRTFTRINWIALGLAFLFAAGCDSSSDNSPSRGETKPVAPGGRPKLMFITNSNADWWNAVEKGMFDGGKALGADVEMRRNEGTTPGQIRLLEDALTLPDVQGVAVSVIEADAPGVADAMRALRKAGKIVIAIDSDTSADAADARAAYIGTNNVSAGIEAGKAAAALRPQGGSVCVFVGTSSAANARERKQGFFEGAGPKFKEIETFDDGGDKARAQSNVVTSLSKYADVGCLLGLWSYNAPRIAEEAAADKTRRAKLTVVTFDLDELAVGHLEQGNIDVSVCQNPYEMGFQGVKLLKAMIEKDESAIREVLPDGKSRDTGVRVIVPDLKSPVKGDNVITIEAMKAWLESKGLRSS